MRQDQENRENFAIEYASRKVLYLHYKKCLFATKLDVNSFITFYIFLWSNAGHIAAAVYAVNLTDFFRCIEKRYA